MSRATAGPPVGEEPAVTAHLRDTHSRPAAAGRARAVCDCREGRDCGRGDRRRPGEVVACAWGTVWTVYKGHE